MIDHESGERIIIPPLTESDDYLRTTHLGNASEYIDGEPGDLIIKVVVHNNGHYQRDGLDIHSLYPLNLSDALLGTYIQVTTINGDEETIAIERGAMHKDIIKLPGKGLFDPDTYTYGDHYVKIYLKMPDKVTKEMQDLVRECFK